MVKHVEIINEKKDILRGYLTMPKLWNGHIVVMFHGFTGNKTEHAGHFRNFSRILDQYQIASLRMDFTGNGESDGTFADFTFHNLISDANLMVDYAKEIKGVKQISLLGFSMGGAVASIVASKRIEEITKVLLWSPAGNILEIIKRYYDAGVKLENGNVMHGIFEISKEMMTSLEHYAPFANLEAFKNQVYIIHGEKDQAVNNLYAMRYATSFPNAQVHIVNKAGHGYDLISEREELYSKSIHFLK